ncbi:F-box/FBD/LRR-repeat protein At5g22660-like [Cornus florida]|uniref:F-box/FBD/LRR-repeat protein At5g22660-like n=1 Tax=Cornus florida TaxID=4283 RepID=UPI00289C2615|nr:F-box/FBD/LRR-repeat protein At5g22660-like [Cornus florida]
MASISNNGDDRISSLPDSLLVHSLSFLPTKYAVGTSVLSSRWKCLWASVPNLDFDANLHLDLSSSDFMNFIERVLLNHNLSGIQKFRLSCDNDYIDIDISRIYTWISAAVKRGVQELDLQISPSGQDLDLPFSLFTCPTLMVLKLGNEIRFDVPYPARFRNLKILHVSICFHGNDLARNLFSNCPVLEDLLLEGTVLSCEKLTFDVFTPALKSSKLKFTTLVDDLLFDNSYKIVINAPVLEYLNLQDDYIHCYMLNNLSSLAKADINVGYNCNKAEKTEKHADRLLALDYAADSKLLLFPNLIRLELHVHNCYGWKGLLDLLNKIPNMVYLVLKKLKFCQCGKNNASKDFNFVEQEVPYCLSMHLQEIEISGFQGMSDELKLIEYFLRNGRVLQKMAIKSSNLSGKQEEKLLMFPRGSRNCEILLS